MSDGGSGNPRPSRSPRANDARGSASRPPFVRKENWQRIRRTRMLGQAGPDNPEHTATVSYTTVRSLALEELNYIGFRLSLVARVTPPISPLMFFFFVSAFSPTLFPSHLNKLISKKSFSQVPLPPLRARDRVIRTRNALRNAPM